MQFKTKAEDYQVVIGVEEKLLERMKEERTNHLEIFRLIESFAQKLLESQAVGEVRLSNDDTLASIDLDIERKETEKEMSITIVDVDLKKVKKEDLDNRTRGSKLDLSQPEEMAAGSQ